MVVAEIVSGSKGLEIQYEIRKKVFVEEQSVEIKLERDEYDFKSDHVLVYEDNIPVGTGRLIIKDQVYLIGRIAVLKEYRGKKYGDLIVRKLVDHGFRHGAKRIEVHSQLQVLEFYKTIGFIAFGHIYLESGIQHQSMFITEELFRKPCSL